MQYHICYMCIGSSYNPDDHFTYSSLDRLEAAGLKVVTSLLSVPHLLIEALGICRPVEGEVPLYVCRPVEGEVPLYVWAAGKSQRPPTWRSLFELMRELGFEELSQQAEEYLASQCSACMVFGGRVNA